MDRVTRFFDIVYRFFMTICKIFFALMIILTSYVVFNRFVLKGSLPWGEPIILMCMVYMCMVSAALAIRKDTHIRMTVIDMFLPDKVLCVLRALAQVCIFAFSGFMIVYGWRFSMVAGRNVITGVGIKSMWLYLSVPFAGIALCLMEVERLINFFDRWRRGVTLLQIEREQDTLKQAEENRLRLQRQQERARKEGDQA
ncbi:MAG: TRAP transporter small permease [Lawsonibacter sp.]|nr:TRAP transporter small permease [Lawsonibacter sp.]